VLNIFDHDPTPLIELTKAKGFWIYLTQTGIKPITTCGRQQRHRTNHASSIIIPVRVAAATRFKITFVIASPQAYNQG
jgi:hypothetical protein